MRAKERIPIILDFFKNNQEAFNKFIELDSKSYYDRFLEDFDTIKLNWESHLTYDLRFGQFLINYGYIPDIGPAWNKEEQEWLVENSYFKFEDIHFWGVNYDKEGNLLERPYKKLLSELDTDHIINILKNTNCNYLNKYYLQYFILRTKTN